MYDGQSPLFESPEQGGEKPKVRWYKLTDGKHISSRDLPNAQREEQLDAMRRWFHRHYEDPIENCPHDSEEGGYQYVYGGPYDASEELSTEFGGVVEDALIEELASELDDISSDWSGDSSKFDADLDDYLFQSSAESLGQEDGFRQSALNVERL